MIKHKHHIIPKHAGGTDDPSNIVELTIEEHAEAHRLLYEQYGRWQDKVAWQGLLGLISHEEILLEMYASRKGENNHMWGKSVTDFMTNEKINQWRSNISKSMQGRVFTDEHRENLSKVNLGKRKGIEPWNKGKLGLQKQDTTQLLKKSKPLIFNNNVYISLNEAEKHTGISSYKIKKQCRFITSDEYLKATSK
jgi:hypothetical protein